MSEHSPISPSSAHRWVKCPASVPLQRGKDEINTEAAREGTAAHEVAELMLTQGLDVELPLTAINGVIIDHEMIEHCKNYADLCNNIKADKRGVELKINCSDIHEQSYGTVDFWAHDSDNKLLYVIDFKYGFRYVCAADNYQLINYASGLITKLNLSKDTEIVLGVYQPRAYGYEAFRYWQTNIVELNPFFIELKQKAEEAFSNNPRCATGDHCGNCAAIIDCEAATLSFCNAIDVVRETGNDLATTPDTLGRQLLIAEKAAKTISNRIEALQAVGMGLAQKEKTPHDYEIKNGRTSVKWNVNESEVVKLGEVFDIDLKTTGTLTPKQAVKAGLDESLLASYTSKTAGAAKLAPVNLSKLKEALSK